MSLGLATIALKRLTRKTRSAGSHDFAMAFMSDLAINSFEAVESLAHEKFSGVDPAMEVLDSGEKISSSIENSGNSASNKILKLSRYLGKISDAVSSASIVSNSIRSGIDKSSSGVDPSGAVKIFVDEFERNLSSAASHIDSAESARVKASSASNAIEKIGFYRDALTHIASGMSEAVTSFPDAIPKAAAKYVAENTGHALNNMKKMGEDIVRRNISKSKPVEFIIPSMMSTVIESRKDELKVSSLVLSIRDKTSTISKDSKTQMPSIDLSMLRGVDGPGR